MKLALFIFIDAATYYDGSSSNASSSSPLSFQLKKCILSDSGRIFSCPMCKYSTSVSTHFKNHVKTHTGEKPYECSLCGKRFIQKGNLMRHLQVHKLQ